MNIGNSSGYCFLSLDKAYTLVTDMKLQMYTGVSLESLNLKALHFEQPFWRLKCLWSNTSPNKHEISQIYIIPI